MADWKAIKTEYITTDTSYRKLAEKYGIDQATIARRAKKEDWVSSRQQHDIKTQAEMQAAVGKEQVDRASRLNDVADKLLAKVELYVDSLEGTPISTQSMKYLSGVLKDIKEIKGIKSDADMREQEARIAKLRREAEKDMGDTTGQSGIVYLPVIAPMPPHPEEDDG